MQSSKLDKAEIRLMLWQADAPCDRNRGRSAGVKPLQAVYPVPFPELGKADTRWFQAVYSVPIPELGKADTRSGIGTE